MVRQTGVSGEGEATYDQVGCDFEKFDISTPLVGGLELADNTSRLTW